MSSTDRLGLGPISRRAWLAMAGATTLGGNRAARASSAPYGAVIYGATPSGIMAAVAAARERQTVALVTAGPLGGMCAQGLGWTDANNTTIIGGLAHSFFVAVGRAYGKTAPVYLFEPHVAAAVFKQMLATAGVTIIAGYLSGVAKSGRQITGIQLTDGSAVNGRYFIDASYEGDLMAAAGCAYIVGRESQQAHGESFAGFNAYPELGTGVFRDQHGNLIDGVKPFPNQATGSADAAVQAYTFRLCLSNDPANMAPFARPANYDSSRYILAGSNIGATSKFAPGALPNHKFDLNGDYVGASWNWPNGTYAERAQIWNDHYSYQAGLLYFMATDPSIPKFFRDEVNQYGLAKDEFTTTGNWPTQLYVREARRLIGRTVLKQQDLQAGALQSVPIGMGSYDFDSHPAQLLAVGANTYNTEGTIGPHSQARPKPYQIPYQALMPVEFDNLLVSVCVSATHVAYSSIRVEPQYMIMGEAAGCAIGLAALLNGTTAAVADYISAILKYYGAIVSI
jgi:hypothetical protein